MHISRGSHAYRGSVNEHGDGNPDSTSHKNQIKNNKTNQETTQVRPI